MAGRRPPTDPDERNERIRFLGVVVGVSSHSGVNHASRKSGKHPQQESVAEPEGGIMGVVPDGVGHRCS